MKLNKKISFHIAIQSMVKQSIPPCFVLDKTNLEDFSNLRADVEDSFSLTMLQLTSVPSPANHHKNQTIFSPDIDKSESNSLNIMNTKQIKDE